MADNVKKLGDAVDELGKKYDQAKDMIDKGVPPAVKKAWDKAHEMYDKLPEGAKKTLDRAGKWLDRAGKTVDVVEKARTTKKILTAKTAKEFEEAVKNFETGSDASNKQLREAAARTRESLEKIKSRTGKSPQSLIEFADMLRKGEIPLGVEFHPENVGQLFPGK